MLATDTLVLLLEAERVADTICWEEAKSEALLVAAEPAAVTAILHRNRQDRLRSETGLQIERIAFL